MRPRDISTTLAVQGYSCNSASFRSWFELDTWTRTQKPVLRLYCGRSHSPIFCGAFLLNTTQSTIFRKARCKVFVSVEAGCVR